MDIETATKLLTNQGYKEYKVPQYDRFFFKWIRGPNNVKFYALSILLYLPRSLGDNFGAMIEAHLYIEGTPEPEHMTCSMNVDLLNIRKYENLFEEMYYQLECVPDPHNND